MVNVQALEIHSHICLKADSMSVVQRTLEGANLAVEGDRTAVCEANNSYTIGKNLLLLGRNVNLSLFLVWCTELKLVPCR